MRKDTFIDNRPLSPIRSPNRPHSPFCRSPFRNQQPPVSPMRNRKFERTPKKYEGQHRIFFKSPRNILQQNYQQVNVRNIQNQKDHMQQTIKKGVGLFKNLAQQNKLSSNKKQNQPYIYDDSHSKNTTSTSNNTHNVHNPKSYECQSKKRQNNYNNKFTFNALLQNVKQIQSIKGFYSPSDINLKERQLNQASFKTTNRSNKLMADTSIKYQVSSKKIQQENRQNYKFFSDNRKYQITQNQLNSLKQLLEKKLKQEEISQDYDDVALLIKKVSQNNKNGQNSSIEQIVKMSMGCLQSFNMKPYL